MNHPSSSINLLNNFHSEVLSSRHGSFNSYLNESKAKEQSKDFFSLSEYHNWLRTKEQNFQNLKSNQMRRSRKLKKETGKWIIAYIFLVSKADSKVKLIRFIIH